MGVQSASDGVESIFGAWLRRTFEDCNGRQATGMTADTASRFLFLYRLERLPAGSKSRCEPGRATAVPHRNAARAG
jgi:hypothetical protein